MTSLFSVLQAVTSANTFARINCIGTEKWRWWIYLRGAKHGENDEIVVDASAILHPADTLSLEPARIYWTFPVKSEKNISIYSVFICVFLEKKNRRNSLTKWTLKQDGRDYYDQFMYKKNSCQYSYSQKKKPINSDNLFGWVHNSD